MLTEELKQKQINICHQLLLWYERECDEFLWNRHQEQKLDASFWAWIQEAVNEILPQRFVSIKEVQDCTFSWQSHNHCFLGH
jgi:hypothetical protein